MTQICEAKKGNITKEMRIVAEKEGCDVSLIVKGLSCGEIVIPKNRKHIFSVEGVGKGLSTKVNANIGTSPESCNMKQEIEKLNVAVRYGAHSIMDLSTGGDLDTIRQEVVSKSPVMVGTVPIYGVFAKTVRSGKSIQQINADDFLREVEKQAMDGVDFITVHCGITSELFEEADPESRVAGIVSRGGALSRRWMHETGQEKPYYQYFDRLLDIAFEHDITISLGDGMRPGAIADATDALQLKELETLGQLVKRCREHDVQVIVEGPGHVPISEIQYNMDIQKKICDNAPFYVLGPLVCDTAPGYDHITAAIGGAIASSHGADFLCYVTPAEHLALPDAEDVRDGVMACRIAAHAGDIAKGLAEPIKRNREMSHNRKNLDWEKMYALALDPDLARERKEKSDSADKEYCSMCGELCAMRQL